MLFGRTSLINLYEYMIISENSDREIHSVKTQISTGNIVKIWCVGRYYSMATRGIVAVGWCLGLTREGNGTSLGITSFHWREHYRYSQGDSLYIVIDEVVFCYYSLPMTAMFQCQYLEQQGMWNAWWHGVRDAPKQTCMRIFITRVQNSHQCLSLILSIEL